MKIAHKITPQMRMAELIDLIEETHHTFTRSELARISELIEDPEVAALPRLPELRACFQAINNDLVSHLQKEEQILFPYIALLDDDMRPLPSSCFSSVAQPMRVMIFEHKTLRELLITLRALTDHYQPKADDALQIFLLYASLAALDEDLVEHMHWEDDVLFPRALEEEKRRRS
ncbi:MAG: hemerythrin domain-containing protein [Methylobacillus sp.]|jgi:regulator of cell morphogenesis and NO signaling|nr:hemerythrin domain-containing protein [Methylobacillus sp.]